MGREVVDKVTKMAAELIFSVDAHISLTHSGGKPYKCDQCQYYSKTAQNLKTHKLTHSGEKPCACDQCKYSSKTAHSIFLSMTSRDHLASLMPASAGTCASWGSASRQSRCALRFFSLTE